MNNPFGSSSGGGFGASRSMQQGFGSQQQQAPQQQGFGGFGGQQQGFGGFGGFGGQQMQNPFQQAPQQQGFGGFGGQQQGFGGFGGQQQGFGGFGGQQQYNPYQQMPQQQQYNPYQQQQQQPQQYNPYQQQQQQYNPYQQMQQPQPQQYNPYQQQMPQQGYGGRGERGYGRQQAEMARSQMGLQMQEQQPQPAPAPDDGMARAAVMPRGWNGDDMQTSTSEGFGSLAGMMRGSGNQFQPGLRAQPAKQGFGADLARADAAARARPDYQKPYYAGQSTSMVMPQEYGSLAQMLGGYGGGGAA